MASVCVLYCINIVLSLQHINEFLLPGPALSFNGKQLNIMVLQQLHFSKNFDLSCITSMMRKHWPSVHDNTMDVCTSSLPNSSDTQLVPTLCSNETVQVPVESSCIISNETHEGLEIPLVPLNSFPFRHNNLVPGSNAIHTDIILNANSEKWCENTSTMYNSSKQDKSVCTLKQVAINTETTTGYYTACKPQTSEGTRELSASTHNSVSTRYREFWIITDNNVSTSHVHDATIPNDDVMMMTGCCKHDLNERYENHPDQLCNFEEIPIVPESPDRCKTGLLNVTCMDTSYQDSNVAGVPSNSPVNESYWLSQCCFTVEKESLVDEESDYELKFLPTQEFSPQQCDGNIDTSTIGSQVSYDSASYLGAITSPAESVNRIDVINISPDSGGLADDGGATLLQDLPLEMARQTDTEILQVCNNPRTDSGDNTDDDFNGSTGKTQEITSCQSPNEKFARITNNLYSNSSPRTESGKHFPIEQADHHDAYNNNSNNLQVVPSDDQAIYDTDDFDGPSELLMAMELIKGKKQHVPCSLNTWERIFSGSYHSK